MELPLLDESLQPLCGGKISDRSETPLYIVAISVWQCLPRIEDCIGVHLSDFIPLNAGKPPAPIEELPQ